MSFDLMFLIVAMYMYLCIFLIYVKSQRHPVLNRRALSSASSLCESPYMSRFQLFRQSRLYVVALRITNFIVFKISADILFFILSVTSGLHDDVITHVPSMLICFLGWVLSDTVDAYVYIFEEKSVRKLLRAMLDNGRARCRSEVNKIRRSFILQNQWFKILFFWYAWSLQPEKQIPSL